MYGVFTTPISHERPPRLNDHFLAYKGVVVQARDYCNSFAQLSQDDSRSPI